jgi:hypothetical protein
MVRKLSIPLAKIPDRVLRHMTIYGHALQRGKLAGSAGVIYPGLAVWLDDGVIAVVSLTFSFWNMVNMQLHLVSGLP